MTISLIEQAKKFAVEGRTQDAIIHLAAAELIQELRRQALDAEARALAAEEKLRAGDSDMPAVEWDRDGLSVNGTRYIPEARALAAEEKATAADKTLTELRSETARELDWYRTTGRHDLRSRAETAERERDSEKRRADFNFDNWQTQCVRADRDAEAIVDLRAKLAEAERKNRELKETLAAIQSWDMLNPPNLLPAPAWWPKMFCTICGSAGPCRCWVRLKCACGRTTMVERFPEAGDADEIVTTCPWCVEKASNE